MLVADTYLEVTRKLWAAVRSGEPGVTVDSLGLQLPSAGYFVGGASEPSIVPQSAITPDDISAFAARNPDARYFGMWVDEGEVYLDTVDWVPTLEAAQMVGAARNELSIYDIEAGECHDVHARQMA